MAHKSDPCESGKKKKKKKHKHHHKHKKSSESKEKKYKKRHKHKSEDESSDETPIKKIRRVNTPFKIILFLLPKYLNFKIITKS